MAKKNKKIKKAQLPVIPTCGKCLLFDSNNRHCKVVVMLEGEKIHIPVDPKDPCFFEQPFFNPETQQWETFNEIKQIRMWAEDEKGNKIDGFKEKGIIKIEYPEEK